MQGHRGVDAQVASAGVPPFPGATLATGRRCLALVREETNASVSLLHAGKPSSFSSRLAGLLRTRPLLWSPTSLQPSSSARSRMRLRGRGGVAAKPTGEAKSTDRRRIAEGVLKAASPLNLSAGDSAPHAGLVRPAFASRAHSECLARGEEQLSAATDAPAGTWIGGKPRRRVCTVRATGGGFIARRSPLRSGANPRSPWVPSGPDQ